MDICVYVHVNKVIRCECVITIIGDGGARGTLNEGTRSCAAKII